jgi:hypothetical protein
MAVIRLWLLCDAEDNMDEYASAYGITIRQPGDLSSVSDASPRNPRSFSVRRQLTESQAGRDSLLDEAVILLDDVVHLGRFANDSAGLVHRTA